MTGLTSFERQSPVWRKLMERFEARLHNLRALNDGPKDAIETADIRGRIAEIKSLMSWDVEPTQD